MHVLIGKRQLVLAGLVVILGLAVFVNWYFTENGKPLSPEGAADAASPSAADGAASFASSSDAAEYFSQAKLDRETSLSAALEQLEAVMASAEADDPEARAARERVAALTAAAKIETDIESLVSVQLGAQCVAVAGEDTVEVIVSPEALNDTAVLRISDIIRSVCGTKYENIRISAVMA